MRSTCRPWLRSSTSLIFAPSISVWSIVARLACRLWLPSCANCCTACLRCSGRIKATTAPSCVACLRPRLRPRAPSHKKKREVLRTSPERKSLQIKRESSRSLCFGILQQRWCKCDKVRERLFSPKGKGWWPVEACHDKQRQEALLHSLRCNGPRDF